MAFTLRQLQFFVAAAEHGSVSGAAKSLAISQSSVTEAIKSLEGDLGITLFERRARANDDGDLVPTGPIRFMAGMESVTGLLLITWSASFTYLEMVRYWRNDD